MTQKSKDLFNHMMHTRADVETLKKLPMWFSTLRNRIEKYNEAYYNAYNKYFENEYTQPDGEF